MWGMMAAECRGRCGMAAHSKVVQVDMVVHGPLTVCTGAMPALAQYHWPFYMLDGSDVYHIISYHIII